MRWYVILLTFIYGFFVWRPKLKKIKRHQMVSLLIYGTLKKHSNKISQFWYHYSYKGIFYHDGHSIYFFRIWHTKKMLKTNAFWSSNRNILCNIFKWVKLTSNDIYKIFFQMSRLKFSFLFWSKKAFLFMLKIYQFSSEISCYTNITNRITKCK